MKANQELRNQIFINRLHHWEVAEQAGVTDATLCRWLRTPLRDDRKQRVENAIAELLSERKEQ